MKYIITILLFSICTIVLSQDKIIKIDNSIIEGKVLSFDGKKIILVTADKTEIRIPKESVSEIKFGTETGITVEYSDELIDNKDLDKLGKNPVKISGFGTRGVVSSPKLSDKTKSGRIVLDVCINSKGQVISAKFKAQGSTTTDNELLETATNHAKMVKFSTGKTERQCGVITYNFVSQ